MVMKRNAMFRNIQQSIKTSFGRYIAIVMIIALGAALFVGLLMTKADMVATGQAFMDRTDMYDLRILNSYGWKQEHLDAISRMEQIESAEGILYLDLMASVDQQDNAVYRFISMPEKLNLVELRGGRMPQAPNECLADGFFNKEDCIGQKVVIHQENDEDSLEALTVQEFTVVGYVATPLYMDMNRGTTSVGSGSLSSYYYVMPEAMELDYIPEIAITMPGHYEIYTDTYVDAMDAAAEEMEAYLQTLADDRLIQARQDAMEAYMEGLEEFRDGLVEYGEKKSEVDTELAEAYEDLLDAEQQIADNEQKLIDGEKQLEEAKVALYEGQLALLKGKQELANAKQTAYKQLSATKMQLMEQLQAFTEELEELERQKQEVDAETAEIDAQIQPLETSMAMLESNILMVEGMIDTINATLELLQQDSYYDDFWLEFLPTITDSQLQELVNTRNEYEKELDDLYQQRAELQAQLDELYAIRNQVTGENDELNSQMAEIEASLSALTEGLVTVAATETMMQDQFAAAEAQIAAGEAQLQAGMLQIEVQEKVIEDGWVALEEGKQELADGWVEYEDGKAEAEAEFADALLDIREAAEELEDGWKVIQKMTDNEVMILDRTSNVSYNNLDSSSDIVQGVSRVLPVFFLLVASLVCITTMTRMVDEERTQIGTLKALGYSNGAIIGKYLFYSGSGAVIGCGVGVTLGIVLFPNILWQAYQIMLYIQPNLVITVNWGLCIAVVAVYTAVLMFVTWNCCRKALREEPAELIRPKSPDAGKKLILEYLPFWKHISFLNKVTIRNIFRYRQRLAMMLVGIGGCTALLVTGYGLRDSIVNVVDYQFENVTMYDLEVYFKEVITEEIENDFCEKLSPGTEYMFYHQASMDISVDNGTKEIMMICADAPLDEYIRLQRGDTPVALPGPGEVVLTVGVTDMLGIHIGDQVVMRNSDLDTLELTVSGIYDNHVSNYAIVSPSTVAVQWGEIPQLQMAFVKVPEETDIHILGAELTEIMEVMNVSISADMANMVRNMMEALDLVVVVVVFCAGLLAAIVLYNLTNININERIREIATIKVLGFRAGETGAYVFKENLSLTVAGAFFGMFLGYLLLLFVMTQVKIDMVWFKTTVMPESYAISVVLTILAALIVDFVFYFKLQSINMAEALKSVE